MSPKLKIGLVTQAYYPVLGGVTEHVWHIGKELERRGHQVTIITGGVPHRLMPGGSKQADDRGLRVLRHGIQMPFMSNGANVYITYGWKLGRTLQRIEQKEKFDVVHVMSPLDPGLPLMASKAMRTPKIGTYHTARQPTGSFFDRLPNIFRPVLRDAVKKIQRHIAVSGAAEEFVHRYFPEVKMTIIPNGVDTELFTPNGSSDKDEDHVFTILFVGRMDPRKGAKYLFAALPFLEAAIKNYRIVVVGTGWMQKYYDAYIPLTLRHRVEFAGYVSPEELPKYYQQADVYCSPATGNESFGIVLLEAMACGRPVVASDIEGYRSVVADTVDGVLVPPKNPEALAQAIISLVNNPEQRKTMGQAGRKKAEKYSWKNVVDQLEPIYQELAKK